ncbi:MAG: DUF6055 domain-containing protein [Prevotella sp.]|jgi:hypothetical protein
MKRILTLATLLIVTLTTMVAQKTVYIPNEWRNPWPSDSLLYKESDPDNKYTWSKSRSIESDNVIVFWDKGYGSTLPSKSPSAYRVDEQDLLQKCEAFFDLEINQLGFVDPVTSNLSKYKVMVLLNHTTDWVCFGGGYDFQVSALWLGPSACKPVGHSVAHEVGHSFHYMCFPEHSGHRDSETDNTGFHLACGNGQAIWEQTAQWQAAQSYPEQMYVQSIIVFRNSHNYAFSHEWHRYQSYWFHYYINEHYNDITTVAQVWNTPMTGQSRGNGSDFNMALMKLKDLTTEDLFRLYFDYACRLVTWDLEACKPYRDLYIGDFDYRCVLTEDTAYQVALASCPQGTGFNVIPLELPAPGTRVVTHLTGLPTGSPLLDADPGEYLNGDSQFATAPRRNYNSVSQRSSRGFRMGYVALMEDGTRRYFSDDKVYCQGTARVTEDYAMTMPEGVSKLWLVVSPALKNYIKHKWDDNINADDMWPYQVKFEGTDIGNRALVYAAPTLDKRKIADATFTYDVTFPVDANGYSGAVVTISGRAAATLGTAFQLQPTSIADKMQAWSSQGPANNKIMFYAVNADGSFVQRGSTANGYGHWFNANGQVSDYASGYVFSEFYPTQLAFQLGQYPGKNSNGKTYTIRQALRYRKNASEQATATFVFNITVGPSQSLSLRSIDYTDPTADAIEVLPASPSVSPDVYYDLQGHRVSTPTSGIYLYKGKKVVK